jgi:hypothetical protein
MWSKGPLLGLYFGYGDSVGDYQYQLSWRCFFPYFICDSLGHFQRKYMATDQQTPCFGNASSHKMIPHASQCASLVSCSHAYLKSRPDELWGSVLNLPGSSRNRTWMKQKQIHLKSNGISMKDMNHLQNTVFYKVFIKYRPFWNVQFFCSQFPQMKYLQVKTSVFIQHSLILIWDNICDCVRFV